jgi:hypothetical protein
LTPYGANLCDDRLDIGGIGDHQIVSAVTDSGWDRDRRMAHEGDHAGRPIAKERA